MAAVNKAIVSFERNIEAQTGRSVMVWVAMLKSQRLSKHGQMVAWLKAEHSLSHSHANHVAKRFMEALVRLSDDDPLAHMFTGKEGLRTLYDRLATEISDFGPDVEFAPKKANVSVRRRRQFALIQPSTRTRIDVGLALARAAQGRLEPSGNFNAMFSHRVRLERLDDIDAELVAWLREAYDAAR